MIKSRQDYKYYLEADRIALGIPEALPGKLLAYLISDVWRYERLLRKTEYYNNCKKSQLWKPWNLYLRIRLIRTGVKIGFTIPRNVFGPGLSLAHVGTLIVNGGAHVGKNCRLHNCVHIGTEAGYSSKAPVIGDNVFIGPGAVIVGGITIADDIAIGANSYVNKSFLEPGVTIAGAPARIVSNRGSDGLHVLATNVINDKSLSQ